MARLLNRKSLAKDIHMNSKQWPRVADFGTSDLYVPFNARGLKTKQTLPPPPPPEASEGLTKAQRELEEREAALARQEEQRKKQQAGEAQAAFSSGESQKLQGQFRTGGSQQAGRGTGLRL